MNFCSECSAEVTLEIPSGDDRPRYVCKQCGVIHYQNPKMVVGTLPVWDGRILLCRRAIEPGLGWWTLPAGYLENNETVQQGARRETEEEAGALIGDMEPFALLNIASISQIYLMFTARLLSPECRPGIESLEVRLFEIRDIPWDELAFSSIITTLRLYLKDLETGAFTFHIVDLPPR